jgi:hypothetical protein
VSVPERKVDQAVSSVVAVSDLLAIVPAIARAAPSRRPTARATGWQPKAKSEERALPPALDEERPAVVRDLRRSQDRNVDHPSWSDRRCRSHGRDGESFARGANVRGVTSSLVELQLSPCGAAALAASGERARAAAERLGATSLAHPGRGKA